MTKIQSDLTVSGPVIMGDVCTGTFIRFDNAQYYGKILKDYIQLHPEEGNIVAEMELKNLARLLLKIE